MSPPDLEAAYAPFVASMLAGQFRQPPPGEWTAELIAAHVARNNDLIAETAEKVAAAEAVSYDNVASVDNHQLAEYADRVGGLSGLAREIERSAARQADAMQTLGDRADIPVHVVIRDGGHIVVDRPMPIGAFIEGNASFHLQGHHEQLKALGPRWESGPPAEFDSYQLVLLERPAVPPELDDEARAANQRQHLGYFAKMRAAGLMMVAGPTDGDDAIGGICLYRAGSVKRARVLAEDDPAVRAGRYVPRVMDWYTAKDAMGWPR